MPLTSYGGDGGNPFDLSCPEGEALVGVDGRGCQDNCVGGISIMGTMTGRCAPVGFDLDSATLVWNTIQGTPGRVGHPDVPVKIDLTTPVIDCPVNQFVVGYQVYTYPGVFIQGIKLLCAPMGLALGKFRAGTITPVTTPGYEYDTEQPQELCTGAYIGTGYVGREGGWIDDWTLKCREIVPVGCGDGVKNQNEECDDNNSTDGDGCSKECKIESGYYCPQAGQLCVAKKADGNACGSGVECISGNCGNDSKCHCSDGTQNDGESDVDCGGSSCANRCALNQSCGITSDCSTGLSCVNGKCLLNDGQVCNGASECVSTKCLRRCQLRQVRQRQELCG